MAKAAAAKVGEINTKKPPIKWETDGTSTIIHLCKSTHFTCSNIKMYLKEDLVYNKYTGALVGFANLGGTNEHMLIFQHSVEDGKQMQHAR